MKPILHSRIPIPLTAKCEITKGVIPMRGKITSCRIIAIYNVAVGPFGETIQVEQGIAPGIYTQSQNTNAHYVHHKSSFHLRNGIK